MFLSRGDKGCIAELLVERIFLESGIKIFGIGVERTYQEFYQHAKHLKDCGTRTVEDERVNQLFKTPDFIILNRRNEYEFIEVKYRSMSHYKFDEDENNENAWSEWLSNILKDVKTEKLHKFWRPEIIFVTDCPVDYAGHFPVFSPPYVEDGKIIDPSSMLWYEDWNINSDVLAKYENIAQNIFSKK